LLASSGALAALARRILYFTRCAGVASVSEGLFAVSPVAGSAASRRATLATGLLRWGHSREFIQAKATSRLGLIRTSGCPLRKTTMAIKTPTTSRTVSQKMGVKEGMRAFFLNAPKSALEAINLPSLEIDTVLQGEFDYIHFFSKTQAEMVGSFPKLKRHLKPTGMLWLSWPKGKKLGTDLALPVVISIGYSHGLVESTCLTVDATWSGLKFTYPKKDKVYQNSYGHLKP
jgi:hypothetical protein